MKLITQLSIIQSFCFESESKHYAENSVLPGFLAEKQLTLETWENVFSFPLPYGSAYESKPSPLQPQKLKSCREQAWIQKGDTCYSNSLQWLSLA